MSRREPEGAWYARTADHYITRGAEVAHHPGGWYARCGKRVRGPISNLPDAMQAADDMLAAAAKRDASA